MKAEDAQIHSAAKGNFSRPCLEPIFVHPTFVSATYPMRLTTACASYN